MARRSGLSPTELLGWTVAGLVVGVAAGFVLGEWLGPVNRGRLGKVYRRGTEGEDSLLPVSGVVQAARAALAQDLELRQLDLEPIAVRPGVVELHGWVPSRTLRARAARIAAGVPGIESLVNCILVHGEDDRDASAGITLTDQSA